MAKNNKKSVTTSPRQVTLRQKELVDGTQSLYLDIHYNGTRKREFLKLYLLPGKSKVIKETNCVTLAQAETIRAERQIEVHNGKYAKMQNFTPNTYFLPYFRNMCVDRFNTKSTGYCGIWRSTLKYLESYCDESTTFNDITPEWIEGFKEYLECAEKKTMRISNVKRDQRVFQGLSQNSQHLYFAILKRCINHALEEHIIMVNPLDKVKGIKSCETVREHLTWDEIQALVNTPCKSKILKRAFLFSCFTGLRRSDIKELSWEQVCEFNGFTRIVFKQVKTGGQEYIDLTKQAVQFLGARRELKSKVFEGFNYNSSMAGQLRNWCLAAGITKNITFHCARHTFAVQLLEFGADIFTVSKMLGHRSLATTEIYAKILDKKKREAVNNLPKLSHDSEYC